MGHDELLKGSEFFAETSDDVLALIVSRGETKNLQRGDVLFNEGDKPESMYVVLSGRIAIAIGTLVDLGIILSENVLRYLERAPEGQSKLKTIYLATAEVSGAILTAVGTTIISFLPVFTLEAAEGKLFGPLAYTKSFVLLAAALITLFILPALTHWAFNWKSLPDKLSKYFYYSLLLLGPILAWFTWPWAGWLLFSYGAIHSAATHYPEKVASKKSLFYDFPSNDLSNHSPNLQPIYQCTPT